MGMMTAPSLMQASIDSHSSTWLPSMMITRSPRRTPWSRSQLATCAERRDICANETLASDPSCSTIHRQGLSLPSAIWSNQSIAQLKGTGAGPL